MRVLLAVHHFLPRYSAGAELYTYRLARWLLLNGHEVEVVCVEELDYTKPLGLTVQEELFEGLVVWRLSLGMAGAKSSWSYDHPLINQWVREHLVKSRPDLVHLHSGYLLGGGILRETYASGVPSVVTLHDFWFQCPRITLLRGDARVCQQVPAEPAECAWCLNLSRKRYRLVDHLSRGAAGRAWQSLLGEEAGDEIAARRSSLRQALGLASLVIAPSRFLAGHFTDWVAPDRLRVLRLGIATAALRDTAPPAADQALRLGYIGQISAHKGVDVLVRAMAQVPTNGRPVTLTIYGDLGPQPRYAANLRRLVEADPRITLAGRFEHDAVARVFGAIDALVVPSIWYENSPLAILEAHAAGRPVIASAMGGMAELVCDEVDGLHFRPGDPADLARQIQRLRTEPGLLPHLRAGIGPVASVDDEMDVLATLYQQVCEQSGAFSRVEVA